MSTNGSYILVEDKNNVGAKRVFQHLKHNLAVEEGDSPELVREQKLHNYHAGLLFDREPDYYLGSNDLLHHHVSNALTMYVGSSRDYLNEYIPLDGSMLRLLCRRLSKILEESKDAELLESARYTLIILENLERQGDLVFYYALVEEEL